MRNNFLLTASILLLSMISAVASATVINPASNNWYLFDVDAQVSQSGGTEWIDAQQDDSLGYVGDGSALTFSFSLATSSVLNLVDAGISGDVFSLLINGNNYTSSAVAADSGLYAGSDFDYAWTSAEFSRLSVLLTPGDYTITGFLNQSAADEFGSAYFATLGGLQIVAVDEPGILLLLVVAALAFGLRRRLQINAKGVLV
ncbi:MAG TPA: hypothetical protein VLC79_11875 [Cellvibrio sp.]|nr:hypothetical protein [Cellvibrio sp.]